MNDLPPAPNPTNGANPTATPTSGRTMFLPSKEGIEAVLVALVMQYGEPLVEPRRTQYSIGRPAIEAAAGRRLVFEYTQDELNPFGRLDIQVLE